MSRVIVVGGSVGLSALLAARLNASAGDERVSLAVADDTTTGRDLAVMLHGLEARTRSPDPEPPAYFGESGKKKAQWKRERNGRRGA